MADTHSIMPKKLAHALMEAGVQHLDLGGILGNVTNFLGTSNQYQPTNYFTKDQMDQLYAQQQQVYGQQQDLAKQLLAQSQGQGPSLAQPMLAQATGQNIAGQQALMAGQRGAGANPALLARLAAQQGAGIQQQSVGQAANLRAQEQLGAQAALQGVYGQMGGQNLQGQNIGAGAMGAQGSLGAQIGQQQAMANQGLLGGIAGAVGLPWGKSKAEGGTVDPVLSKMKSGYQADSSKTFVQKVKELFGSDTKKKYSGGEIIKMLSGGNVPGEAEVDGDSPDNDTQLALLSPGEIVLPRSVAQAPDMEQKAMEFLKHLKKTQKNKGGYC